MFSYNGKMARHGWCVYVLYDSTGTFTYIGASRISNVLGLTEVLKNPAFNIEELTTINITQHFSTQQEATAFVYNYLRNNPWPALNKTAHANHYSGVRNIRTGETWRNASDCAKANNINPAQLSQHLRKLAGYKTIKGEIYEHANYTTNEKAVVKEVRYVR